MSNCYAPRADMTHDRHLNELRREGVIRSHEPYAVAHRPWSELTKHWSPERKAANARAGAKIRDGIRRLQAQARKEGRDPAEAPPAGVIVAAHAFSDPPRRARYRTRA